MGKRLWFLGLAMALGWLAAGTAEAVPPAPLRVESLLPKGQVEILSRVVVRFSEAMVPLGQAEQAPTRAPLQISPRPAGQYRWLDPQTLAYILDRPLAGAAQFKVTVPAGATARSGAKLARAVHATITTPAIALVRLVPEEDNELGPQTELRLTLNQPVKLASLEGKVWFELAGRRLPARVTPAELPDWERRELPRLARLYLVACPEPFPAGAEVTLRIEPGVAPENGDLPLAAPIVVTRRAYRPLAFLGWEMATSSLGGRDPAAPLVFKFNNPVSLKDVWPRLAIQPPVPAPTQELDYPTEWAGLNLAFQPRTTYRVTLGPGLKDQYGTELTEGSEFTIETGDLEPRLELPGMSGVLETAEREILPLRVRNLAEVRLGLAWHDPAEAVPALVAEAERPWNQKPKPPAEGAPGVRRLVLKPGAALNQAAVLPVNLAEALGRPARGGLLLVDVRATWPDDEGRPKERVQRALVQISDLGLALKLGRRGGVAWATRLKSGEPLAGAELSLRDRTNRELWRGISGEGGLAVLPPLDQLNPAPDQKQPWRNPVVYLLAKSDEDFAVLPAEWGDALRFSLPPDLDYSPPSEAAPFVAHGLCQLPLYQPGQTVRFVVYLRGPGAGDPLPAPGTPVKVTVEDPQGRPVGQVSGLTSPFGSLQGSLELTPGARLGGYTISAEVAGHAMPAGGFRVASFRPPDFRLDLSAPGRWVGGPAPAPVELSAAYLFGQALAGAPVTLAVRQEKAAFAPPSLAEYAVGDLPLPDQEPRQDQDLGSQRGTLDAGGRTGLPLPAAGPLPGLPVRVTLEAKASDPSGLAVRRSLGILVHPADFYLGLKAPLLAEAQKPAELSLAAADLDDAPAAPGKVGLVAYREYWETVREKGPGGFYHHLGQPRREEVWREEINLGKTPLRFSFTPPRAGLYVVAAEAVDRAGRATRSATYLYASGGGVADWQRFDDHRLEMVADRKSAAPGQVVRLMLQNPFARATALVTVERDGVARSRIEPVEGPAPVIEVPITAADAPGTHLGVLLVRGRTGDPAPNAPDLGRPQVRIGYVALRVAGDTPPLRVEVTPDRTQLRPGDEVAVKVAVRRGEAPQPSEVTLLAVDERILAAAEGDSYDPRRTFDRQPALSVLTADTRTRVLGRLAADSKGGGSPGDEAGGGGLAGAMRQRFHPAVFWLAQALTDDQGALAARFTLPDSLTGYRLVAVAAGPQGDFGLGNAQLFARLPLQVLSALPRFATVGDRFEARVLVQNLSEQPARVTVEAQAEGLKLVGPARTELELAPGQSRPVGFAVAAVAPGPGALLVRARHPGHEDAARFGLTTIPATPLITTAAAGTLAAGQERTLALRLPAGAEPGRGGLTLSLAPSLAGHLTRPAAYLVEYPWNCLEQRLSRAAGQALAKTAGPTLGLPAPVGLDQTLAGLAGLLWDYQTPSGGFAFWPGGEAPDHFLTAYAVFTLERLSRAGLAWPAESKKAALNYLRERLRRGQAPKPGDLPARTSEAFTLAALATAGVDARPALEAALNRSQGLPPFGLAALLLAAGEYRLSGVVDQLVERLEASATVSAAQLHFATVAPGGLKPVLGSLLRDNALALLALARHQPAYPRLDGLARWVAEEAGSKPHLSTQEAVFALWGLAAYLERVPGVPDLTVRASLAGRLLGEHRFAGVRGPALTLETPRDGLTPGREEPLALAAQGSGQLFWTTRLAFAPSEAPRQPVNAGLSLSRYFQPAEGGQAGDWRLGQEIEQVLTIINTDTRHHVLVEAPFPAGLEPVGAARGQDPAGEDPGPWRYRELRQTGLVLYAARLAPGVYSHRLRLRAVAPGDFVLRPARAEEMYAPEVMGATAGERLVVKPAAE